MFVEYMGGELTAMQKVFVGLPFTDIWDLFYFIGVLVIAGILVIWTVGKIAMAIKGD